MAQSSEHATSDTERPPDVIPTSGPAVVGLVTFAGALTLAVIVLRLAAERMAAVGSGVLLGQPTAFVVLPLVLVAGWIAVGTGLLDERPLAVPVAAGAFLGAAAVDLALLWGDLAWPVPYVDPASFLILGTQAAVSGYPGGVAWSLTPVVGTAVSTVIGGYLAVIAYRSET